MSLNPQGRVLAIKTSHGIVLVDSRSLHILASLPLPKLDADVDAQLGGNAPAGIAWNGNAEIWDTDAFSSIHIATKSRHGLFAWTRSVNLPLPRENERQEHKRPALSNTYSAPIGLMRWTATSTWVTLSRANAIALVDVRSGRIVRRINVGVAPYGLVVASGKIYISNWGGSLPTAGSPSGDSSGTAVRIDPHTGVASSGTVSVVTPAGKTIREIAVGLHPNAILASHDGRFVYVSNASSDTVSVIDSARDRVIRTLRLRIAGAPFGATPDALAVDAKDRTLFVAEAGANTIAAIDVTSGVARYLSTAWYPSALVVSDDKIFVACLKGVGSRASDFGLKSDYLTNRVGGYNAYDFTGTLATASVRNWNRRPPQVTARNDDLAFLRRTFHHVVVIVKENHTYDDIYGDLARGNGDRRLCLFCYPITPNQHALADRFGVFDNFYVNGTLSADGHNWMDEGYATDYLERSMSGWARSYPSAGNDALAYSPAGFIWNRVIDSGLTFRDYGEFIPDVKDFFVNGVRRDVTWSGVFGDYRSGSNRVSWRQDVSIAALRPYVDMTYPGFSLRISDQIRATRFIASFDRMVSKKKLSSLLMIALPNDHTAFSTPGFPTPDAFAADNDLALGRIISAITYSPYWRDTVVFVVEDDAQDGTDHVDGHRTGALVISAHNKEGAVNSHFYNQTSILRTIEIIFGLAPMSLYDASAPPIIEPFQPDVDLHPYDIVAARMPLDTLNPPKSGLVGARLRLALESEEFTGEDEGDPRTRRAILRYLHKQRLRL